MDSCVEELLIECIELYHRRIFMDLEANAITKLVAKVIIGMDTVDYKKHEVNFVNLKILYFNFNPVGTLFSEGN